MSKTLGQFMLDEAIPSKYRPTGVYTKKDLQRNMVRLAKDNPEQYARTITEVKRLGDEFATLEGISVGLDDIAPQYASRDAILKPAMAKIKRAKTRKERQDIAAAVQDKLIDHAYTHPGTMGDMARSGARGNALQLMRTVGAPAAVSDERDNLQPWLVGRSYSEGLKPSEWWAANREARMAAVKSNISVTEPGDLSKILVNNTSDQVITEHDCRTTNGLKFSVKDSALIDRFLAKGVGGVAKNTLITPRVLALLKKARVKHILARSPMTCESSPGICQKCSGANVVGELNKVGENIGIRASQALGEPLTQFALNAKHGVRASGNTDTTTVAGLEGFRAIIESPASFKNKATLAPSTGNVTAVEKAPQGGYYIDVAGTRTHTAQGLNPIVRAGQKVYEGDTISEGVPRPDEVVKYKGLGAGRAYMVGKLNQIYKDSGYNVDQRHFEVLAKSALNHLRIEDIDDETSAAQGLVRGDIVDYNRFRNIATGKATSVKLDAAEDEILGESLLHHLAGTRITEPMIDELRTAGIKSVKITSAIPSVSPIMAPATRNPLLNPDWVVRLGHRYLKQSLLEGAQKGQTSNLHGTHPVPGIIFSSEFGEGTDGRY